MASFLTLEGRAGRASVFDSRRIEPILPTLINASGLLTRRSSANEDGLFRDLYSGLALHYLATNERPIPAGFSAGATSRRPYARAARPHPRGSQSPRY